MDSFHVDTVRFEKPHAIPKHGQLHKITNYFRFIEICVVLILISRFSSQLPTAFKASSEYFRDLSVLLVSPRFVFVIGNIIVITLFVKSGQLSTSRVETSEKSSTDIYDLFVKNSERSQNIDLSDGDEVLYQSKKQSIVKDTTFVVGKCDMKIIQRSQSHNLNHGKKCKQVGQGLKRSSTMEKPAKNIPEEGMSNEEFRRKIDAFIARQQRLRREEEYSANTIV